MSTSLPAPTHVDIDSTAPRATERHEPRNGPRYEQVKVVSETSLPAPGTHVSDHGRH